MRAMMTRAVLLAALAPLLAGAPAARATGPHDTVADALADRMTLAEKIGQIQSAAPAIPRLGLPAYEWWNEGLHGLARDGYATVFPQAIGLAATWDTALLARVGATVATQARARFNAVGVEGDHQRYGGLTLWSPNVNIFRDPRWGRGQETYGEDPYLTGRLAVAFVRGVQGPDPAHPLAIATPKHFAVHSGPEAGRHAFDIDVSPHDLEDTYLPAFRAAVVDGGAQSVMCAYNALHGTPVCADADLLQRRLRQDWAFAGYVVSDCDAVDDMNRFHHFRADDAGSAAAAVTAGTDLNCGGGGRYAYASLGDAVSRHLVDPAIIDRAVRRVLAARARLGALGAAGGAAPPDPRAAIGLDRVDDAAAQALALEAARESIVLLKNQGGVLPFKPGVRLAVVGPDADALTVLEANYHGTARAPSTPLAALRARLGEGAVLYAQGSGLADGVPVLVPETALRTQDGRPGLTAAYYGGDDFSGTPALVRVDRTVDFDWDHVSPLSPSDRVTAGAAAPYSVRWTGRFLPPAPGDYTLSLKVDRCFDCAGHDGARLLIDGKVVAAAPATTGRPPADAALTATLRAQDTRPHTIVVELAHAGRDQGVHLMWLAPDAALRAQAVAAAHEADAVVAFVGLSPDLEGEELGVSVPGFDGGDRTDLALPAPQRALLQAVATSGKPLVVVLMSGGAVALPWARDHAAAVLAAWYPGQAGGRAVADTLMGLNNPSGRLPVTFYRSTRDLPPFVDYAMAGRTYRYFTGTPLYPFGFGLSYTRFAYGDLQASAATLAAGQPLSVAVTVRNTGDRAGDEVAQLYLTPPAADPAAVADGAPHPRRWLAGFQRVRLKAGESRRLTFTLDARDLSLVDAAGGRAVEAGRYQLFVGGGQPGDADGRTLDFTITGRHEVAP